MIQFVWPWLMIALPLPWLLRRMLPPLLPAEQAALKVPFLDDFAARDAQTVAQPKKWPLQLAMLAWLLLILASMRPQWLGEPIEQAVSGRDLMLAIDLSGSMEEQDFVINKQPVDRLTAAKWVASDFIARRTGDRIGLILFALKPYLQAPLTFDRKTVNKLLDEALIGMADEDDMSGTAIGDAIGLAVKRLQNKPANSRVLILMTDGANTAGEVPPLKAAELAAKNQLKIYTIGIGADEMIVRSLFGTQKINPSRDLDEKTLLDIAQTTGGRYFRARDTSELNNIYMLLDQLEPVNKDSQFFRPRRELFYWPLAAALALAAAICSSRLRWP